VRRAAPWLAALLALLASGCLTGRNDTWIGDAPAPGTRDELYRLYGPPDGIRRDEGRLWLRYDSGVTKGMTLGARAHLGVGLLLSRTQTVADRVWVEVAPDGRIVSVQALEGSSGLRHRLWPFGR
jgi:hypothetical protein